MAGLVLRTVLVLNQPADPAIRSIAERWVAATRVEQGVVDFQGYLNEGSGRFVFLEHYRDSEAFMVHRGLVDPALRAELYAVARFEALEVYGDPSPAVGDALSAAGPVSFRTVASR